MKVMIVGGGGREHALAWKAAQSDRVQTVLVAPGNAGTAREPKVQNRPVQPGDLDALVSLAKRESVDLTIVGPEAPLAEGIAERFDAAGLAIFAPSAQAAMLEVSKDYAKQFLARHKIPTAEYQTFEEVDVACAYIRRMGAPIVVKADGLAAGKGVTVAMSIEEATLAVRDALEKGVHGSAGKRVVIEQYLSGEEASFICMVAGDKVLPLASSQDHKARDEGDQGPNTGGMGAYSPAPILDDAMQEKVMRDIVRPVVKGLRAEGIRYVGFLYIGLMIGEDEIPKVLEFNCRLGDPETQPILYRLRTDIVELCEKAIAGTLSPDDAEWDPHVTLGVVLAAEGYPGSYPTGQVITGLDESQDNTKVFHAGTALDDDNTVTAGGRVLCVCARGATVSEAKARAYARAALIDWPSKYYRPDIGYRAIARETAR